MYKARQKFLTGWKAGGPALVALTLGTHTPTSKGRRLTGEEFEAAKRRLMERDSAKQGSAQADAPVTR